MTFHLGIESSKKRKQGRGSRRFQAMAEKILNCFFKVAYPISTKLGDRIRVIKSIREWSNITRYPRYLGVAFSRDNDVERVINNS